MNVFLRYMTVTPTLYASTVLDLLTVSVTSRMRVMGKLAKVICKHDVIALRSNMYHCVCTLMPRPFSPVKSGHVTTTQVLCT